MITLREGTYKLADRYAHKYGGNGFVALLNDVLDDDGWVGGDAAPFGSVRLFGRRLIIEDDRGNVTQVVFGRHSKLTTSVDSGLPVRVDAYGDEQPGIGLGKLLARKVFEAYELWEQSYIAEGEDVFDPVLAGVVERHHRYVGYCMAAALQGVVPHSYLAWRQLCDIPGRTRR